MQTDPHIVCSFSSFVFFCSFFNTSLDPQNWYEGSLIDHNLQFKHKLSRASESFRTSLRSKIVRGKFQRLLRACVYAFVINTWHMHFVISNTWPSAHPTYPKLTALWCLEQVKRMRMNIQIPAKGISCSGLWAVSRASHRIRPIKKTPANTLRRERQDHVISSVNWITNN